MPGGEECELERLLNEACDPKSYSPAALAFIGDCVYELFVRELLVCEGNCPAKTLHRRAVALVRCEAQAAAVEAMMPLLTEEEAEVLRRGRNAHTKHTPKNSSQADYHMATGFETLVGYLYLKGEILRLRHLFQEILSHDGAQEK